MRKINTTDETREWKIVGINLIPSDSLYQKIMHCIATGQLSESYLQNVTGHRLPITVDYKRKRITFSNF